MNNVPTPRIVGYNDALWGRYEGWQFQGDDKIAYNAGHDEGAAARCHYISKEKQREVRR